MAAQPVASNAVATKRDLQTWIQSANFKEAVKLALPKHLTPDRFVRVALTALMRTPKLAECSQESVFKCLLDLSSLGLEPDGRRAHLIPYKRNVKEGNGWRSFMECQLIIDYKGLVELMMRSGTVSNIHADVVCENDEFEYDRGEVVKHKIDFKQSRGNMYAAYCRITFKDGTTKCEALSRDEVDRIRSRSKAKDDGPWVTDYNEMAKKTAARRVSKWVVLSPEDRDRVEADDDQYERKERPEPVTVDLAGFLPSGDENRGHDATADQPEVSGDRRRPTSKYVSAAQIGELYEAAEQVNIDPDGLKQWLAGQGYANDSVIPVADFDRILAALKSPEVTGK